MDLARRLAIIAASIVVAACAPIARETPTFSPVGPRITLAPPSPTPDGSAGPASTAKPFQQTFGPEFPAAAPTGALIRISDGALLSRDRSVIYLSFTGGPGYLASDQCSDDYRAWAHIDSDTLEVAIEVVDHGRTFPGTPIPCLLIGYGYVFRVVLPRPFDGTTIRDLGAAALWVPPPDRVAEPGLLPPGWLFGSVRAFTSAATEPGLLERDYGPDPSTNPARNTYLRLVQAFGGASGNDYGGDVIATATVHGQRVDVRRYGGPIGGETALRWFIGADEVTLFSGEDNLSVDTLIAIANAISEAPPPASPTP